MNKIWKWFLDGWNEIDPMQEAVSADYDNWIKQKNQIMTDKHREKIKIIRENLQIEILEHQIIIGPPVETNITISIVGKNGEKFPVKLDDSILYKLRMEGIINT